MDEILRTNLGATGVTISRLGLGGHTFAARYGGMNRAERKELIEIVSTALEEGINLFDVTKDEERETLGSIMKELGVRDRMFVTCWIGRGKTATGPDVTAETQRALALLGVERVDVLYLDWTCTPQQTEAMCELRSRGLTRFIGLLGTSTALASDISRFDVVLVNHNYYWRDQEPDIRRIRQLQPSVGIIALEPLGRGRFALDETAENGALVEPCLKYALGFDGADAVLVAVRRLDQLQENVRIWKAGQDVTDEELTMLATGQGYDAPKPT